VGFGADTDMVMTQPVCTICRGSSSRAPHHRREGPRRAGRAWARKEVAASLGNYPMLGASPPSDPRRAARRDPGRRAPAAVEEFPAYRDTLVGFLADGGR